MSAKKVTDGSQLFIVDNSDNEWKVLNYLNDWTEIANSIDIASAYFEIGSLLALDGQWQKLEKIRILMGGEVSKRTRDTLLEGIKKTSKYLDDSIEKEKEKNDFLHGVPAIVEAIRNKQIECRIYTKEKFHAKTYITHAKHSVIGSFALVGSSNFTLPGLTNNVELNVQISREVNLLQDWYEKHWKQAEDVTPEVLKVIERHTREYTPFEVYCKSLQEYFRGHELTAEEWDISESRMYHILDQYQKEGYHQLLKISKQFGGAFLCDGVGLGKTYIGLMLIERLIVYDRMRVALLVPKAIREDVWKNALRKYLPHLDGDFSNLAVFNHTDLSRAGEYPDRFQRIKEFADVIIIDEAHHFRNPGIKGEGKKRPSRYRMLFDISDNKTMFFLTATPINNRLIDFQHVVEFISRREPDYFKSAPLGIHSLRGHINKLEKTLEKIILKREKALEQLFIDLNQKDLENILFNDSLFRALVVQRSREYVKQSQKQSLGGNNLLFPVRKDPKVINYSIKKTYGNLLDMIEDAFSRKNPLFSLAIYYPLAFYKGDETAIDPFIEGRQKQVVGLIRTLFLKRFESSAKAFESSCETLLLKLLTWITKHASSDSQKRRLERWKRQNADLIDYIYSHQFELFEETSEDDLDDDIVTDEMLENIEELSPEEYEIEEILAETYLDLDQIVKFLNELKKLEPSKDDKLISLKRLLKNDPRLSSNKVIIFTEYMTTARYIFKQLKNDGFKYIEEVDSTIKRDRSEIIRLFSPYYNESSSKEIANNGKDEIRILITTDVLAEGLNLQDASLLINYDIHWNPVKLMQRIGRIDRRLSKEIEEKIINDHPEQKKNRGKVYFWNFLPPEELEKLLNLYRIVTHKTLRISKVFGIEGKKVFTPEDEYDALKNFNHLYEGSATVIEKMHLEYQKLLKQYPELEGKLNNLPGRVFSGKEHPKEESKAVFFCYNLPAPDVSKQEENGESILHWTEEAGYCQWYLYDLKNKSILTEPVDIIKTIRCKPNTPRIRNIQDKTLSDIREKIEKHIKNTYLKKSQAPIGVKPILKAWMELS